MIKKHLKNNIIIGGAGISGLITAFILANKNFHITLIDKNNLQEPSINVKDARSSAISFQSMKLLQEWNIWESLAPYSGKIDEIRITNNHHPLFLHFDGKENFDHSLGYMILNNDITLNLLNLVKNHPNITILGEQIIKNINYVDNLIEVETDKTKIHAKLLIGADGKFSTIRNLLNIENFTYDYKQTALVFNVYHELPHNQIAHEIFMKNGPFAILPLKDENLSSIVWTEETNIAKDYLSLDIDEFNYHLQNKFKEILGNIKVTSNIISYPLSVMIAKKYIAKRVALIADAAHSIHPIAGQGLNQGIKDIASLFKKINEHQSLGLDIASFTMLEEYQTSRNFDNLAMYFITDGFNKLFSNDIKFIKFARIAGIAAVNKSSFLKNFFMKYAMGKRLKD